MSKRIRVFLAVMPFHGCFSPRVLLSSQPSARSEKDSCNSLKGRQECSQLSDYRGCPESTSEIRELPILRPVKSGAQSRAEIQRMVIRNLDEDHQRGRDACLRGGIKETRPGRDDFQYPGIHDQNC